MTAAPAFAILLLLLLAGSSDGCRRTEDFVYATLQRRDSMTVSIFDLGNGRTPVPRLANVPNREKTTAWRRVQQTLTVYDNCADGKPRITLRNTLGDESTVYFYDPTGSAAGRRLSFLADSTALESRPVGRGILHEFDASGTFDKATFKTENNRVLGTSGRNVVYSNTALEWQVLPTPKFSTNISGGIWVGNPGDPTDVGRQGKIRLFRPQFNQLDTRRVQAPNFEEIPKPLLNFTLLVYKLYTGFDNTGRFTYIKSIVAQSADTQYYLAPTIDRETAVAIMCEEYRPRGSSKTIIYQTLRFKAFNDVAKSRRTSLAASNVRQAKLADERFFTIEESARNRVRLRLSYDLDKYLALLKFGKDNFRIIVTNYRTDLPDSLSFEFDSEVLDDKTLFDSSPRPELACSDNSRRPCVWPGEVEDKTRQPNSRIQGKHPSCSRRESTSPARGQSSGALNRGGRTKPTSTQRRRQQGRQRKRTRKPNKSRSRASMRQNQQHRSTAPWSAAPWSAAPWSINHPFYISRRQPMNYRRQVTSRGRRTYRRAPQRWRYRQGPVPWYK